MGPVAGLSHQRKQVGSRACAAFLSARCCSRPRHLQFRVAGRAEVADEAASGRGLTRRFAEQRVWALHDREACVAAGRQLPRSQLRVSAPTALNGGYLSPRFDATSHGTAQAGSGSGRRWESGQRGPDPAVVRIGLAVLGSTAVSPVSSIQRLASRRQRRLAPKCSSSPE